MISSGSPQKYKGSVKGHSTNQIILSVALKKQGERLDYVSCFPLHLFLALAASCVLYYRTEYSRINIASFVTCRVRYVRVRNMFATYLIVPFYHFTSTTFQNQHLMLKKSALVNLKWAPCSSTLSWLSSSPRIAKNGTAALTRERKQKTCKDESK